MAEVLEEKLIITLDMIQWWWWKLPMRDQDLIDHLYRERFDHGDPEHPPQQRDYDWFMEEYEDDIRDFHYEPQPFQVIGYYEDTHQRYADVCIAYTPKEAEKMALEEGDSDLCVCAVLDMEGNVADLYYGDGVVTSLEDYGTTDS